MRSLAAITLGLVTTLSVACGGSSSTPTGSSGDSSSGNSNSGSAGSGSGSSGMSSGSTAGSSGSGSGSAGSGSGSTGSGSGSTGSGSGSAGTGSGSSTGTASTGSSSSGSSIGADASTGITDGGGSGSHSGDAGVNGGGRDASVDSGVVPAGSISCNAVLGIDSTSEWFTGGFESQVNAAHWEIIYHHPGYVSDWADPNDAVWSTAVTLACATNSTNPDRVIFNGFADPSASTYMTSDEWVTGLTQVVENLKKKFSKLRRIDLLTMTRAPNNQPCVSGNRQSVVETYVDDAISRVVAAYPGLVTASPKFYAPSCDVFASGGPHFTDAGKPVVAKVYGDYYSTEP
jgi:hypothetical protein